MNLSDSDRAKIRNWLAEDIGSGDITTNVLIPDSLIATAFGIAKEKMIVCGCPWVRECFLALDPHAHFEALIEEGRWVESGERIFKVNGKFSALLTAERTALNILQRLSGIATLTKRFVEKIGGTGAAILDTRKTTPGLRKEEKYATSVGGAKNYRMGLYDLPMIKDNHLVGIPLKDAIKRFKGKFDVFVVEVKSLDELKVALDSGAPWIMLDNFEIDEIKEAVRLCAGRAKLEVSGNVNIDNVRAIAECGVDYISVGAITHSAKACDISLEVVEVREA